jgi:hypothetical protein
MVTSHFFYFSLFFKNPKVSGRSENGQKKMSIFEMAKNFWENEKTGKFL